MYTSALLQYDFTWFSCEGKNGDLNRGSASFHKGDRKGKKKKERKTNAGNEMCLHRIEIHNPITCKSCTEDITKPKYTK